MIYTKDTDEVYAQLPGGTPRWKVGSCNQKPTIEWVKQNTGIDVVKVGKIIWNSDIDAWVIVLLKSERLPEAASAARYL